MSVISDKPLSSVIAHLLHTAVYFDVCPGVVQAGIMCVRSFDAVRIEVQCINFSWDIKLSVFCLFV